MEQRYFLLKAPLPPDYGKLQLVKDIKAITGWGLKEAKETVDYIDVNKKYHFTQPSLNDEVDKHRFYEAVENLKMLGFSISTSKEERKKKLTKLRSKTKVEFFQKKMSGIVEYYILDGTHEVHKNILTLKIKNGCRIMNGDIEEEVKNKKVQLSFSNCIITEDEE